MSSLFRAPLTWILLIAMVVRFCAYALHPDTYPDAFFQYLEPAWWHLHGYGFPTWEWSVGLRSWIPPALYGGWMEFWGWFGLATPAWLSFFFALQGCVFGLIVVWGVARMAEGLSGSPRTGWLAATVAAFSPMMAYYTPQTLIETPALAAIWWGLVRAYGPQKAGQSEFRRWWIAGFALSLGGMLRLPFAVVGAFVALERLCLRRKSECLPLIFGAFMPIVVFGLVDWLTWGKPFHSMLAFMEYHAEGRGAEHGAVRETSFYLHLIWDRAGLWVVTTAALLVVTPKAWAHAWRPLVLMALAVGPQMVQPQKLERFILLFWPLLAVCIAVVWAAFFERYHTWFTAWTRRLIVSWTALLALWQGADSLARGPKEDYTELWGLYEAQTFTAAQPDLTGLLIGNRIHLTGGSFRHGRNITYASLTLGLLQNPLFNYAIVEAHSPEKTWVQARNFTLRQQYGNVRLWEVWQRPVLNPKPESLQRKKVRANSDLNSVKHLFTGYLDASD